MTVRPIVTAAVVVASLLPGPARADPPTSRPVNELDNVRVGNGTVIFEPGKPDDGYGGNEVPIYAAPLPAGHQDAMPVELFLRQLQSDIPRFRYIVHHDGTGPSPGPVLPAMDTTDLTLGEWVNYVNDHCPGVHIEPDTTVSEHDPLYVVKVSSPTTTRPATGVLHVVRAVSLRAAVQVQQRVRSEDEKTALADVLSLIQVLVGTSPDGPGVKLKVHEPTGMLIVDAPPPVADAIAAAVETMSKLTPEQQRLLAVDRNKLEQYASDQAQLEQDRTSIIDLKGQLDRWRDWANRHEQEYEAAQRQLAAAKAATRPTGGNPRSGF